GIVWGGFTIATIFVGCRAGLRFRTFRRFYIDDVFVLVAWVMVLASTILWQCLADSMYFINAVARGVQMPPSDFAERSESFSKASIALMVLFYSALWSIKLSFIFFFRRLYVNMGSWTRFWWITLTITIAAWAVCVGNVDFKCLMSPLAEKPLRCRTDSAIKFSKNTLMVNCMLDILTDTLILLIPMVMLWKVRISRRRKLALGAVFSATVFIIVFAIVRVALIDSRIWKRDTTWLCIWSNVE
ncbi:hypothetical protein P154DRAFT_381605, partial [Amniculicola lignicola CBS 123094]